MQHTLLEMEGLNVAHWLRGVIDHEGASDHNKDCARCVSRLRIGCVDTMLDLLEGQSLRKESAWLS
jgi:hypothetical protein